MKPNIRSIKFKRDPRFTPGISEEVLNECEEHVYWAAEWAAEQFNWREQGTEKTSTSCFAADYCGHEFANYWKVALPSVCSLACSDIANELGLKYMSACFNYIIVCGSYRGWWSIRKSDYRKAYSMANGYYGW